ncbi:MAG: TonB family protein [Pseudomonadota bacterium]
MPVPIAAEREEPRARLAALLALAVHGVAIVALTFGFHLQRQQAVPVTAELWTALPESERAPPPRPVPEPPPPPPPESEPTPARPAPPPPPPPEPKAPSKADIELKAAEARRRDEARKAVEAKLAEKKAAEAKRREDERKAAETKATDRKNAERKAAEQKALDAKRREDERAAAESDRLRREQEELGRRAAEAAAAAQAKLLASYVDKIRAKVRGLIVEPPGVPASAMVEFDVVLIPGGDVLSVRLRRSSGHPLYDEAVERAIKRAEPLPIPPEPQQFAQFRELRLQIRRQDP